ncbi:CPBP family glutamic-type intramembrane protease [Ureibacillus acetophenoni]|uniref:CAAX prenyl protease-like protein n=1 Tax=Ureibacillus acetophenoni TaxID=614649 RepID=A0A285UUS4_9BACL|nr:CPBP family glutamic-type intramembrane protease [Ureibacillus acetophenoni]SOC43991.1 CAAX prenyl protease-like protein [Ureibacillus acetophenoni]
MKLKLDFKIALLLAVICFIGGLLIIPYSFNALQSLLPAEFEKAIASITMPFPILMLVSALQVGIVTLILAFIGLKVARKAGFSIAILDALFNKEKILIDKAGMLLAIVFGAITAFTLSGGDYFYFQYKIEAIAQTEQKFSLIGLAAGALYGGVFEEVLLRLLFMSIVIWIFLIITRKTFGTLNPAFFWFAIILAAVLFAVGHLPATEVYFGELNSTLIVRSLLLNGIGGIFFGYLYWKKGLEYAIVAHMFSHIWLQIVFIPIFY